MTLRPYSSRPLRLLLQVCSDVLMVVWVYGWYRVGRFVHDSIMNVADVGYSVQSGAGGIAGNLRSAGEGAGNVPVVGDALGAPLRAAGGQVAGLADSGRDIGDRLASLATPAGWFVALWPILLVGLVWLVMRLRFARRAGASAELAAAPAGEDLLALRALATRPLHELNRVSADPVAAWRSGDPEAVRQLAALELRANGVPRRALTRR